MALAGEGAVAIWHDITPEARNAFYAWHGEEHMPERVGIPGFLRGRRYVAIAGVPEFFNLYEALSSEVLVGTDYRARLDAPTPWTVATVAHFRNVARGICRVAASYGKGCGGLIATLRYDVRSEDADRHLKEMREAVLPRLAGEAGVAGAHLLVADAEASGHQTAERRARGGTDETPRWVVLLEGWGDAAPFEAFAAERLGPSLLVGSGARGAGALGIYQLQTTRLKTAATAG